MAPHAQEVVGLILASAAVLVAIKSNTTIHDWRRPFIYGVGVVAALAGGALALIPH